MRRIMMNLILILTALALASCHTGGGASDPSYGEDKQNEINAGGAPVGEAPESGADTEEESDSAEEQGTAPEADTRVKMIAVVDGVGERLEVTVTESEYAFGVFRVITPAETVYRDSDGAALSRSDIKVGDTVEIWYSGQVMLSYPPQIVAHKIILK